MIGKTKFTKCENYEISLKKIGENQRQSQIIIGERLWFQEP